MLLLWEGGGGLKTYAFCLVCFKGLLVSKLLNKEDNTVEYLELCILVLLSMIFFVTGTENSQNLAGK